jgi:hypothetical protein
VEAASVPADGGEAGQAAAPATPDLSSALQPVLDRVSELGSSVNERLSAFESRLPGEEPAADDNQFSDDLDPSLLGIGPNDDVSPEQAAQYLDQLVDKRASQITQTQVQQAVEPLIQELDDIRTEREAQTFLRQFPEFADEQRAEQFMQHAQSVVEQLGIPEEQAGRLISSSSFLSIVAKAARHEEAGRSEVPADQAREQPLEPAGGANLGGGEQNPALDIVRAGSRNSFWTG